MDGVDRKNPDALCRSTPGPSESRGGEQYGEPATPHSIACSECSGCACVKVRKEVPQGITRGNFHIATDLRRQACLEMKEPPGVRPKAPAMRFWISSRCLPVTAARFSRTLRLIYDAKRSNGAKTKRATRRPPLALATRSRVIRACRLTMKATRCRAHSAYGRDPT